MKYELHADCDAPTKYADLPNVQELSHNISL